MSEEKGFFEVRIRLRSFNISNLEILNRKIKFFANNKKFFFSSINLPVEKKKITVLKSPHVNKKARDQFEFSIFNRMIIIKGSEFDGSLWKEIKQIGCEDVSTKLTVFTPKKCLN